MLGFRHKLGPGFLILIALCSFAAATILQLLVSIGLPSIKGIYFLTFTLEDLGQTIKFGIWTICTDLFYSSFSFSDEGSTCQPTSLGYEQSQFGSIADFLLIAPLAKALVVQPISCGFAGLATLTCLLHLCSNFIVWPFVAFLAGIFGVLAFVFEIVLFTVARVRLNSSTVGQYFGQNISESSLGPAIWIQLVAAILVAFGTLMSWTAYTQRKLRKTHTGKLGTSNRNSLYDGSEEVTPSKQQRRRGLFMRSSTPARSMTRSSKGGLFSRLRGGKRNDDTASEVAMRDLAAPVSGAGEKAYGHDRQSSKSAKVSRWSGGSDDFEDLAGRRSRQSEDVPPSPTDSVEGRSRRSSGAAALAGRAGVAEKVSKGRRSTGSAKEAYSSQTRLDSDHLARRSQRRRSEESGEDVFHETEDVDDKADLGYLLGSRRYSATSDDAGRSGKGDRPRSGEHLRTGENFAVKRKPAPTMNRDGIYGSAGARSAGSLNQGIGGSAEMKRNASEPLGDGGEDSFISPRKGRRSARYSAHMAEQGWD